MVAIDVGVAAAAGPVGAAEDAGAAVGEVEAGGAAGWNMESGRGVRFDPEAGDAAAAGAGAEAGAGAGDGIGEGDEGAEFAEEGAAAPPPRPFAYMGTGEMAAREA